LLGLRVAFRYVGLKATVGMLWLSHHKIITSLIFLLLTFIFSRIYFPSTALSDIIASFLLVEYLFGTMYYVGQVIKKIEGNKNRPDLRQITMSKCELAKKDVDRYLTLFVSISGVGLATMILVPLSTKLPVPLVTVSGIFVEMATTILFALLYWWLFFLLMERFSTEKAATWAGIAYLLPTIIGGFATVEVALYFGLNFLQDSVATFLPFLIVYYLLNRSIPDFQLSPYVSLEAESTKVRQMMEEIKKDLQLGVLKARKTRLEIELTELQVREKMLKEAMNWFEMGYKQIEGIRRDFVSFLEEMKITGKTYENKKPKKAKGKICLLIRDKIFIAKQVSSSNFQISEIKTGTVNFTNKETAKTISELLSLHAIAVDTKNIRRPRINLDLNEIQKIRSMIAVEETNTEDMPEPCREFDRRTLIEYIPVATLFELNKRKYETTLYHMSKHPCLSFKEKFEEAEADLLFSIEGLSKRIQERIDTFLLLQKDHPECYMIKAFTVFFGLFGVGALRDSLRSLDNYKTEISNRREKIQKLSSVIKIEFVLPESSIS
jgi:hypothetical protein